MIDKAPSFSSSQFKSFAQRNGISLFFADPRYSTSNGKIERVNSMKWLAALKTSLILSIIPKL